MPRHTENGLHSPSRIVDVPSDSFLTTAKWNSRASANLRKAAKKHQIEDFCRLWQAEILPKPGASKKVPAGLCLWSLIDEQTEEQIARSTRLVFAAEPGQGNRGGKTAIRVRRPAADHLSDLVLQLATKSEPWSPVETLIAGELLVTFGRKLNLSQVWMLWQRLARNESAEWPVSPQETPDEELVRTGEIPFLTGLLSEPLREANSLREQGRRVLVRELTSRVGRDGTPHAELLSRLPLWLAPLIRATLWAEMFQVELWSEEERQRLLMVLERSIPLCRPNGRLALSNGHAIPVLPIFDVAVKSLSLTGPAEKLWRMLKTQPKSPTLKKRTSGDVEMMPSAQSDWARVAVLRSHWGSHADSLAIAHHQPVPQLDVAVLGHPLLQGAWGHELQIGDAMIEPAKEWSCSCWASDPDADYLELKMTGPGGLRVERQILLSRRDHFLLLADCVRGAKSISKSAENPTEQQPIHLRSRLPLVAGIVTDEKQPTRELRLKAGKQSIRVFPLALAEDRVQSTPHEFFIDRGDLVLHQIGIGNGLYAPLIFDWHPQRTRQSALWRTLTVTEAGKVVGRDIAAGHRLQIGKHHLLIYRSLAAASAARAVLGHHTWHESIIARVDSNGDVDAIMNVDP